jgi:putative SOS response-associated peptidase YedK
VGFPPTTGRRHIVDFRKLELKMWRDWLDREHRCVVLMQQLNYYSY